MNRRSCLRQLATLAGVAVAAPAALAAACAPKPTPIALPPVTNATSKSERGMQVTNCSNSGSALYVPHMGSSKGIVFSTYPMTPHSRRA